MRLVLLGILFVGLLVLSPALFPPPPKTPPISTAIPAAVPTPTEPVDDRELQALYSQEFHSNIPHYIRQWGTEIRKYAGVDIPINYFAAVMWKESCGNPYARSYTGLDIGLMQINITVPGRPSRDELYNVDTNLQYGAEELVKAARFAGGYNERTYIGYNWGVGNVYYKGFDAAPEKTKRHSAKMYRVALGEDVWGECWNAA